MNIPLNAFEQYIEEKILKRGLQYFKKGFVGEPDEMGHGNYQFIVSGTEDYTVDISIKNDVITEYVCTCPYDYGAVCKHLVACLFYLQEDVLELNTPKKRAKKGEKSSSKKKTVAEQIDELLDKISHEDLKQYIRKECKDKHFRHYFTSHFAYLVAEESQEFYDKQIKAILSFAEERYGYISYSNANRAAKEVQEFLDQAEQHLENNSPETAMMIACAVLENMIKALGNTDDSSGYFSGCIKTSMEILDRIAKNPNEKIRKELFDYFLSAYKKEEFRGWDWHTTMLSIATDLVKNKSEATEIYNIQQIGQVLWRFY